MSQVVSTTLVDDITGEEADQTVKFSLDGQDYVIDLTAAHAAEMQDIFAAYIHAGRAVTVPWRATRKRGRKAEARPRRNGCARRSTGTTRAVIPGTITWRWRKKTRITRVTGCR